MSVSKLSLCLIFLIFVSVFVPSASSSDKENEASSVVNEAKKAIVSAYKAVLDAESTGANVSGLLFQLSEAADLLAEANMSHEIDDFYRATLFADKSTEITKDVKIEAYTIRDLALYEYSQRFMFTLAGSIVGILTVLFVSFVGWRFFKRRYCHRILKLKPVVTSDES